MTFFGEALPTGALAKATGSVLSSSVCLVVGPARRPGARRAPRRRVNRRARRAGTSLNVAPANLVPGLVKARWGKLVVCNLDESGRGQADVFLQGRASETLPRLVAAVRAAASASPRRAAPCAVS